MPGDVTFCNRHTESWFKKKRGMQNSYYNGPFMVLKLDVS